ncbi:MAG: TspO/MBR family protein [Kineosporiaceae bacterium]
MTRTQVAPAAGFVLVVLVYASLSGLWTSADPGWYAALARPSWQPPPWVFGVIWPLNFLALMVAGIGLSARVPSRQAWTALAVLAVSVACALAWAYLFYVPHALGPAAAALGAAAVLTWLLVVLAWRFLPWTSLVLLPYGLWMTVAATLSLGYWRMAR